MGFLLENITETEALEVGAGSSAVLPLGGFVKGDPIVLITYKTCRETTAVAQKSTRYLSRFFSLSIHQ